ncbi:MAG: hypothetical protein JSU07_04705 [Bacteroidetes bacterium]|nr:hypothetical protein [Bacteroidota bacterium]
MKKYIILFLVIISIQLFSQKGKLFPVIDGENLNDKAMSLPIKNGKTSIIAIAFNRHAEEELKKWLNPLYYTFVSKNTKGGQFNMSEVYDINFVFVPLISGFKKIKDDFKNSTDKEFWPFIMDTKKTDIKLVQEALGVKDNKIPYFFVVDKEGKITELQSGNFSNDKVDKLEDAAGD